MPRLLFPFPLVFLLMGLASCDTALNQRAVDAGIVTDARIPDVGVAADGGNVSEVGSAADVGVVADIAPTSDGGISADLAPTSDVSIIVDAEAVADADAAAADEASFYSACRFGSGVGRILIAKKDFARDLCVVLVLDRPGTNPFAVVVPTGWGVEAAYEAPAAGSDCQRVGLPAGAVSASDVTGVVAVSGSFTGVDATLTFPAPDGGPVSEPLAAAALDSSRTCSGWLFPGPGLDGGFGNDDGAPMSTLSIDFTGPGAHLFAAQWLVFQPDESGSINVDTEIASSWATHPRAVEVQSLSLCGTSLNEDESIRSLQVAGFPTSANPALSNVRSVQISEVSPIAFCGGAHHANGTWTFINTPVMPTVDPVSGLAIGTMPMSEDDVDLVAVLFNGDSFVRSLQYQTSP